MKTKKKTALVSTPKKRTGGEKFTSKYNVEAATIYKGDTDALKIPGPNHPLFDPTAPTTFDPIRVEQIDQDGTMSDPVEVWSDPDTNTLWVLDGRGRTLDVREVNRRRSEQGREPVKPYIVTFSGNEKEAVARVRIKNYHRRVPTPSGMALDLAVLRKQGWSWQECANKLHVETTDPEQWARKLMPLAYCVEEVRAAVDAGKITRAAAKKFGGTALDGSAALGRQEQLALLDEMLEGNVKEEEATEGFKPVSAKHRERIKHALSNGATKDLKGLHVVVAKAVAAAIARIEGDTAALAEWPSVAAIVENALKPLPRGPKKATADA